MDSDIAHVFEKISIAAKQCAQPVYVIGGFVRDYYLGRLDGIKPPDIDFVTVGSGTLLAEEVSDQEENAAAMASSVKENSSLQAGCDSDGCRS